MTSAAPKTLRQHSGPPVEFAEDDATVDQFMRPSLALPQKQVKSKKKKTAASNSSNHYSNHYSSNNNKKKNFKSAVENSCPCDGNEVRPVIGVPNVVPLNPSNPNTPFKSHPHHHQQHRRPQWHHHHPFNSSQDQVVQLQN